MSRTTLQFFSGLLLLIVGIYSVSVGGTHKLSGVGFVVWGVGSLFQAWMAKNSGNETYGSILATVGALIVAFDFFYWLYKR